ncbi:disease resistance protein RPV1-like [Carya illinoinensis]|uniref:disease resistance protein RPV1-like n=1 Tax=Carya illinoinensis TaxID=32201 RepID=UPI001C7222F9|nr:disease resistance protein RPV1-like [Carya illinoinensis]
MGWLIGYWLKFGNGIFGSDPNRVESDRNSSISSQVAEKLMVVNLRGCHNLFATPDFSGHQKLEKLDLKHCHSLIKIHESIGNVSTLLHLNLSSCRNLVEIPTKVFGLKNLENLILSDYSKLKKLPMDIGDMRSLKELLVDNTAIQELPESFFHLSKLEMLKIICSQFLTKLPNCIGNLSSLKELSLNNTAIEEIPNSVGSLLNLEILSLIRCESLTSIPDFVGNLISLKNFLIHGLASIVELQLDQPLITSLLYPLKSLSPLPLSLVEVNVANCTALEWVSDISKLESLHELNLANCQKVSLKNLRSLSMPGDKTTAWFSQELRSGNDIHVREQDPQFIKGVEVKKCGLYLIFEGGDDYKGDEELLDKSQSSISEKLAKFFSSSEDDDHIFDSGIEVDSHRARRDEGRKMMGRFLEACLGALSFLEKKMRKLII